MAREILEEVKRGGEIKWNEGIGRKEKGNEAAHFF